MKPNLIEPKKFHKKMKTRILQIAQQRKVQEEL